MGDGGGEIWLKGNDIASFLNYTKPEQIIRNNVPTKWIRSFGYLMANYANTPNLRNNGWRYGTSFVTELGAYALLSRRIKEPEVVNFAEWLHTEIHNMKRQPAAAAVSLSSSSSSSTFLSASAAENDRENKSDRAIELARWVAEKSRCDAEKARFDAEIAKIELSHRFVTTIQNLTVSTTATTAGVASSAAASTAVPKEENQDYETQDYVDDTAIDLTQPSTGVPRNIFSSENKHQRESIDSVSQCSITGERRRPVYDDDEFEQCSNDNFRWANDTLKRLYEKDPTSISVKKLKL